jgi:pyruvate dehydrogenase E2 component (dihydrolipoamide acetyltransferase)
MTRTIIPQLDANLVDVTITCWKKTVGDSITQGETIAELTTDKAVYELEAPASGRLLSILAQAKSVVPTGYIVALIGDAGEEDPAAEEHNDSCMAAYRGEPSSGSATDQNDRKERVRATPKARRLAKKNGLDLEEIQQKTGVDVVDEAAISRFLAL